MTIELPDCDALAPEGRPCAARTMLSESGSDAERVRLKAETSAPENESDATANDGLRLVLLTETPKEVTADAVAASWAYTVTV